MRSLLLATDVSESQQVETFVVLLFQGDTSEDWNANHGESKDDDEAPNDDRLATRTLHVKLGKQQANDHADARPEADPEPVGKIQLIVEEVDES